MTTKRESRAERDERIVREAGPWELDAVGAMIPKRRRKLASFKELAEIMLARHAMVRLVNALSKRVRRKKDRP